VRSKSALTSSSAALDVCLHVARVESNGATETDSDARQFAPLGEPIDAASAHPEHVGHLEPVEEVRKRQLVTRLVARRPHDDIMPRYVAD
jgi:hypothetical protein